MPALRITDMHEGRYLAFDLRELLDVIGDAAIDARWQCDVEQFTPRDGAKYLPAAYENAKDVHGAVLYQLAANTLQVVDGKFIARHDELDEPWVILEAFDSTSWDVITDDEQVIAAIHAHFRSVESAE